jgi:hypothetical protein
MWHILVFVGFSSSAVRKKKKTKTKTISKMERVGCSK